MAIEDILVALRAVEEGAIDRDALTRLLEILDSHDRGGIPPSCGELLTRQFRIDPALVRRWEREIGGESQRRIGRYQLRRKVGQGGMGVVFEAVDPSLGRTVALKLLAGDRLESPTSIQRFLREARSAGRLNHPNIVHAYDADFDGHLPFLVMEFIDGENFYQVLKRRGAIDARDGVEWLGQAARALDALERHRWVHGDVKPSNFILTRAGTVKLADLGLCGPPGKPRPGSTPHGTPPYIAPEVLAGDWVDHRADLYSLGATFYHLLAGKPHRAARTIDQVRALAGEPLRPLADLRPDLPASLVAIVMRLLAAEPEARFAGGGELLAALEPILAALPDPAAAGDQAACDRAEASHTAPRRGLWVALFAAVAAVGIAIGTVAAPRLLRDRGEAGTPAGPTAAGPATDAAAVARLARWEEARARLAGEHPALLAWLATEGAEFPESPRWREEVLAELAARAEPAWSAVAAEVEECRTSRRFRAALAALDRFPQSLRAGPYEVAWHEAVEAVRRDRQARLARALLELEGAPDPLVAWQRWRALESEPAPDLAWYRLRLREELGGLPFLAAIDRDVADEAARAAARPAEVRAALAAGLLPAPDPRPGPHLLAELALSWLAEALGATGRSEGPLLERLAAAELLERVDPELLGHLLAAAGERADPHAECRAGRLAAEARAACRAYDRAAAQERWTDLAGPGLRDTAAARRALAESDRLREELRRGAFLRSDAFVAAVTGDFGETPRFRWEGGDPRLLEEWRAEGERWSVEPAGRRARGRDGWQGLELAVPFAATFDLAIEVEVPDPPWAVVIGRGEAAIAIAGSPDAAECRAVGGERGEIAHRLAEGRGAPWLPAAEEDAPRTIRIALRREAGLWRLGGAEGLLFPGEEDPPPAWIWLALPPGALLRSVEIVGEPVPDWLTAREALTGAR